MGLKGLKAVVALAAAGTTAVILASSLARRTAQPTSVVSVAGYVSAPLGY